MSVSQPTVRRPGPVPVLSVWPSPVAPLFSCEWPSLPRMTLCSHSPSLTQSLSVLCFMCAVHFLEVSVLQTVRQKFLDNLLDQNEENFIIRSCCALLHESILTFYPYNVPPVGDENYAGCAVMLDGKSEVITIHPAGNIKKNWPNYRWRPVCRDISAFQKVTAGTIRSDSGHWFASLCVPAEHQRTGRNVTVLGRGQTVHPGSQRSWPQHCLMEEYHFWSRMFAVRVQAEGGEPGGTGSGCKDCRAIIGLRVVAIRKKGCKLKNRLWLVDVSSHVNQLNLDQTDPEAHFKIQL